MPEVLGVSSVIASIQGYISPTLCGTMARKFGVYVYI